MNVFSPVVKTFRISIFLPVFAVLAFFTAADAQGCTSRGPGAPNGCGGCDTREINKDRNWKTFLQQVQRAGVHPISCYRSYACQANLARTCGRGRAAKPGNSNHERGIAMDFRTSNNDHQRAQQIARQVLTGSVRGLTHGGGGFHMSNGRGEGHAIRVNGGGSSPAVAQYRAERTAARTPSAQSGPCASIRCVELPGENGLWYKRRNGRWVRMTWEPVRS